MTPWTLFLYMLAFGFGCIFLGLVGIGLYQLARLVHLAVIGTLADDVDPRRTGGR